MAQEPWQQIVEQQAETYIKGAEVLLFRHRFLLNRLKAAGRITNQTGGIDQRWKVRVRDPEVQAVGGFEQIQYASNQPYEGLDVPWAKYRVTDAIHRHEKAMVGGEGQIVSRAGEIVEALTRAMTNKLCADVFIDGYASGNENKLLGLQSCTGYTAGSTAAADWIAFPNDSYGGQSTALGAKGGTWTKTTGATYPNTALDNDWPFSSGDPQYDWNTPLLVRETSTQFNGGSAATWAGQATKVVRRTVEALHNLNGLDMAADLAVMDGQSYTQFKDLQEGKFSINVPQFKGTEDTGFVGDVLNFEGLEMSSDFNCPAGHKFILQPSMFHLTVLNSDGQSGMFYKSGPRWDHLQDAWTYLMGSILQLRYRPKGMADIFAYTASA